MADYHKYMFDDFVVENRKEGIPEAENEPETEVVADSPSIESVEEEPQIKQTDLETTAVYDNFAADIKQEQIIEETYSKEDLEEAVRKASEEAYRQGKEESSVSQAAQQNKLLEEISNQLTAVFSRLSQKETEREEGALKVAVAVLRKVFPSIEKQAAETEIKKFLSENFASVSEQELLSFSFNPESISLVANSLGKLAEQNDFEGKIAVHKDNSLGLSDCKIEWKDGRIERRSEDFIDKVEDLIETEKQERENG